MEETTVSVVAALKDCEWDDFLEFLSKLLKIKYYSRVLYATVGRRRPSSPLDKRSGQMHT